jgi:ABC-type polysaccharide/polyol phosphate transport system ATPase subunit
MTVITEDKIDGARALTLRQGLRLEIMGMKRHGKSCYAIIKAEYGLTGGKVSVHEQFTALLKQRGILA